MRNHFYPEQIAAYLPYNEILSLRKSGQTVERDSTFGRELEPAQEDHQREATPARPFRRPEPKPIELDLLAPGDAHALLEELIPPTFEFYRTPIGTIDERRNKDINPEPQDMSKREAARTEAPAPEETPRQTAASIYGSVTVDDIAQSIKALVHAQGQQGRVVLPDEDIRFVRLGETASESTQGASSSQDEGLTGDKIKKLGEYEYEIRVRGWEGEPLNRVVRVLSADENETLNQGPASTGPDSAIAFGGPSVVERTMEYA